MVFSQSHANRAKHSLFQRLDIGMRFASCELRKLEVAMIRILQTLLTKSTLPALTLQGHDAGGGPDRRIRPTRRAEATRGGGGSGSCWRAGGGGHSFSGGGGGGRSFSGGGARSYSGGSYAGRAYSGGARGYAGGSYGARGYAGGARGYAGGARGFAGGGFTAGRFYAGRGYFYGGRFWASPVFRFRYQDTSAMATVTAAGGACGYYDGYWLLAACSVPDRALRLRVRLLIVTPINPGGVIIGGMSTEHIHLDLTLPLARQPDKGHNRWHPDIPPIVRIAPGSSIELETLDAVDGQIQAGTSSVGLSVDLNRAHPLTGPVYIEGAEPGDLLAVKIDRIATARQGFTAILPGFGFLRDLFLNPFLAHWDLHSGFARSEQLPGVAIPGAPFMGVMGVAPSHELLARIAAREAELITRGGMALPPDVAGAVPATEPVASRGLRTIPPRENGGNFDIKQLVAGSTLYLPVFVPGALFSVGDTHFAQGDGESCGTAIETSSTFTARFEVLKGEAQRRKQSDPSFCYVSRPNTGREYYATTGISVDKDGRNESENLNLAARNALMNMIDYIADSYRLSREQAYCVASVAVNLRVRPDRRRAKRHGFSVLTARYLLDLIGIEVKSALYRPIEANR